MVAYHEAGHTIVGLVLSRARVVHKVTIIPRGRRWIYDRFAKRRSVLDDKRRYV